MQIHCSYSELRDVDALVENPRNFNQHGEKQIESLAKIMKHQGWRNPITVSKRSGFIVAGHGRLMAAKRNGWTQAPVDLQDFATEADEYAHLIADNKIAELAETDELKLKELVAELPPDFDVELVGLPDVNLLEPDFSPASEGEQGQLDQKQIVIMECPHCGEKFEKGQAKIIN